MSTYRPQTDCYLERGEEKAHKKLNLNLPMQGAWGGRANEMMGFCSENDRRLYFTPSSQASRLVFFSHLRFLAMPRQLQRNYSVTQ